jgi:trimethylamine--corrinoid protein Co-methyltransferase
MPKFHGGFDPFSEQDYRKLHEATLTILDKVGVYVDSARVLECAAQAGATVDFDKKIVRFPGDLIERNIANCKNSLDRRPRPDNVRFSCDGGGGFVLDYQTMRQRPAVIQDIRDFSRLADALENVDEISFPVYASDVPMDIQDLVIWRHVWAGTSKTGGGGLSRNGAVMFNLSRRSIEYLLRLARVRYKGDKRPGGIPLISGFIGAASPLRFERDVMDCMLTLIDEKQTLGIGSNVIAGAQSPVTLASVVAMENAERMAGLSLALAVDPDVYTYFCNHPNFLDMLSANVANGSPEHSLMATCATGLLRHYGFQLYANHPVPQTGGQVPGIQASVERAIQGMLAGLSGASGVCVCGAVNESMSYEQLVIDNNIAGMIKHYMKGFEITDEDIALDVIEEVGIGGNFLEHLVVAQKARSVYWNPGIWNRKKYSEWIREGAKDILEQAHEKVESVLATHHPKPLSDDQESAMDEILREAQAELAPNWEAQVVGSV